MKKSNLFLILLALELFLLAFLFLHASYQRDRDISLLQERREIAKRWELTDLCLFTEASYTRHLTMADLHTPFQSAPASLDHCPSGSILAPPSMLRKGHAKLD